MGEGWGGGGALAQRSNPKKLADAIKRSLGILKHLAILKAKNAKSLRSNPRVTFGVMLALKGAVM
jgi:protein-arginine kinase